jgi:acetyl esterase/lipase
VSEHPSSDAGALFLQQPRPGYRGGLRRSVVSAALRASLLFTPRPTALLIRKAFAAGGRATAAGLEPLDPTGVVSLVDERYGPGPDALLDVHRPDGTGPAGGLPVVLWVHGGGWLGGSKEELAVYFRLIAREGHAVVAPRYSLAPEHHYPTPLRQVMDALSHVQANAERLRIDPTRIVLAGDSAGAQIAAQVTLLVSGPEYARSVGISPTITPQQLRGVVLACGPYDLRLLRSASTASARRIVDAALWAYSGSRRHATDRSFALVNVVDYLTRAFPPALITVGNADPLRAHSELLVERLRACGVEPETLFFPVGHEPALGHEYQFDLATEAGRRFFERMRGFLQRVVAGATAG